jgi:hypothetical protein
MEQNHNDHAGSTTNGSESFGNFPKDSEGFGNFPHASEGFRTLQKPSERGENHTLTVREVARMFEAAGVARTERSIINWCQPNKTGIARLDSYFDPNDRKYFIAPQSVDMAIAEEKAKTTRLRQEPSEMPSSIPKAPEDAAPATGKATRSSESDSEDQQTLKSEIMDLKILNRGKDYFIEQLQKERTDFMEKAMQFSHRVGELETKLLQLKDGRSSDTGLPPENGNLPLSG